jgi:hypothetical protein
MVVTQAIYEKVLCMAKYCVTIEKLFFNLLIIRLLHFFSSLPTMAQRCSDLNKHSNLTGQFVRLRSRKDSGSAQHETVAIGQELPPTQPTGVATGPREKIVRALVVQLEDHDVVIPNV